jgi:hypothetical protein
VLGPLAKRRHELAGFIRKSARTAEATAAQGDALEANLRKLPGFLRKLGPAADDFSALADQMTPALESLRRQSGAINSTVEGLGPTVRAATPALVALGAPAGMATKAIPSLEPATKSLGELAQPLRPLSADLGDLSSSFDNTGGIEDVMKFIYYYTAAINGEDQAGHYVRSALQVNVCSGRLSIVAPGCESNFARTSGAKVASAAAQDQLLNFLLGKSR